MRSRTNLFLLPCLFPVAHNVLLPEMRCNFRDAASATSVFQTNTWLSRLLLVSTMDTLSMSPTDASAFLHLPVRLPSKHSPTGHTKKTVNRYLKQTVLYFYTQIGQTAVKHFVDSAYKHSNHKMGQLYKAPTAKRAHVVLTEQNALVLLSSNKLLDDVAPWAAVLDALVAVIDRVGAGATFSEADPSAPQKPRSVCLLPHLALVLVKIIEHLKRMAGMPMDDGPAMSAGHRMLWEELLGDLHAKFRETSEPQGELRLRDEDPSNRATVEQDDEANDGVADSGTDDADGDDVYEAAEGAPAPDSQ